MTVPYLKLSLLSEAIRHSFVYPIDTTPLLSVDTDAVTKCRSVGTHYSLLSEITDNQNRASTVLLAAKPPTALVPSWQITANSILSSRCEVRPFCSRLSQYIYLWHTYVWRHFIGALKVTRDVATAFSSVSTDTHSRLLPNGRRVLIVILIRLLHAWDANYTLDRAGS